MPSDTTAQQSPNEETVMKRNPIQKSFGAGINRPKVIPNKRKDRTVKHRKRWREDNACGAEE
jgi:hypothetical protein